MEYNVCWLLKYDLVWSNVNICIYMYNFIYLQQSTNNKSDFPSRDLWQKLENILFLLSFITSSHLNIHWMLWILPQYVSRMHSLLSISSTSTFSQNTIIAVCFLVFSLPLPLFSSPTLRHEWCCQITNAFSLLLCQKPCLSFPVLYRTLILSFGFNF